MSSTILIIQNPFQDSGENTVAGFSNNLSFSPTVEELNRATTQSGGISEGTPAPAAEADYEPLFGTHLREAADTLKKVFG